ncbi:uncharacterized protein Bfra_006394 [Botrytis fragariae]|uniref:Uncharacterized protein n=1 Tax=Botrytis fragariae TaxID=1964551 RepID=A0A8H6B4C8_9HELO|nr:uncharacterized protein Bfra_006394 [Botrytis fragariae]KAF5879189.1 hypothetical protein Bfra_006394 [Botrytis fragariae]
MSHVRCAFAILPLMNLLPGHISVVYGYNLAKAAKIQGYDSGNEAGPLLHDDLRGCIEHTPSNNLY